MTQPKPKPKPKEVPRKATKKNPSGGKKSNSFQSLSTSCNVGYNEIKNLYNNGQPNKAQQNVNLN